MESIIELLTKGLETINIPAQFNNQFNNLVFEIPACRVNGDPYFRITHNVLMYFYHVIQKKFPAVKLQMDENFSYISPSYCVAACYVEINGEKCDLHFGENKVTMASNDAEKQSPFNIAVNRAQDKAILKDLLGLATRIYHEDGTPILYRYDEEEPAEAQAPKGLNSVEEDELRQLSELIIPVKTSDGKSGNLRVKDMPDALLKFIATASDPDGVYGCYQQNVLRYIELRKKKEESQK